MTEPRLARLVHKTRRYSRRGFVRKFTEKKRTRKGYEKFCYSRGDAWRERTGVTAKKKLFYKVHISSTIGRSRTKKARRYVEETSAHSGVTKKRTTVRIKENKSGRGEKREERTCRRGREGVFRRIYSSRL